jgi:aryl-alcohol dehydrogenase-like predicted oxidoreductase
MKQLEDSLRRLRTDRIDLWQVHEVAYDDDPDNHYADGGVLDALTRAKEQGKVRFVGFTGHKHPRLHLSMIERGFAFDAVQMPLNPFDGQFRSFEREVLPVATTRGMACLGMKSLGGSGEPIKKGLVTPEEAMGYVLSLPIASLVSGIDSLEVLEQNLAIARAWKPMSDEARAALRTRLAPFADDGRYELYKTSMRYDGPPGREQHGFPPASSLPL